MKAHLAKAGITDKEKIQLLRSELARSDKNQAALLDKISKLEQEKLSEINRGKAYKKHYLDAKAQLEAVLQCKAALSDVLIAEQAEVKKWHEAYKDERRAFVNENAECLELSRKLDGLQRKIREQSQWEDILISKCEDAERRGDLWCYIALASIAIVIGLLASIVWG